MKKCKDNLFGQALCCLMIRPPVDKVTATLQLYEDMLAGRLGCKQSIAVSSIPVPGRPDRPELVDPKIVPRRNFSSLKGRLSLVHAIAHIEFNAINLALDAVYRFQQMPEQYYIDWCRVAAEEAQHFSMLSAYLRDHGVAYGDQTAHNGLWEMALKTEEDVMIRMALVPRVLEARGLDVTPTMIRKLQAAGDDDGLIIILQKIFDDEIGHVKIGTHWFHTLCQQRGLEPQATFLEAIKHYMQGAHFGPFEKAARIEAGFCEQEMQNLLNHFG